MGNKKPNFALMLLVAAAPMSWSQDPPPPPAQAPPALPSWSVRSVDLGVLFDGYYAFNFNHPSSSSPPSDNLLTGGGNQLYNFNANSGQISLNMVKLSLSHTAAPFGFQVDLGFGKGFEIIHSAELAHGVFRNLEQAYVSFKPPAGRGLQIDFGQFVTSAGAEVIETNGNWNYSRSLLFAWAEPSYHFGLRLSKGMGSHFTGGFQLVNGWSSLKDNNTGKTIGVVGNFNSRKISWNNTYYTGPENAGTNRGFRNLYDSTLVLTPGDKLNAYINFDYGSNRSYTGHTGATAAWYGIAGAAKFQVNRKMALTPRIEWFKDRDGFQTGLAQELKEFTMTYEYKWVEGLLARLEYRRDWSDRSFFQRASTLGASNHQDTVALGVVAYFGPKR